jgi:hypothetical protein
MNHEPAAARTSWARRWAVAIVLQLPALALAVWGDGPWARWIAALWGGSVWIAATDSGWRWRNRLLILLAALWVLWAAA